MFRGFSCWLAIFFGCCFVSGCCLVFVLFVIVFTCVLNYLFGLVVDVVLRMFLFVGGLLYEFAVLLFS